MVLCTPKEIKYMKFNSLIDVFIYFQPLPAMKPVKVLQGVLTEELVLKACTFIILFAYTKLVTVQMYFIM